MVDDASVDGTSQLAHRLAAELGDITVIDRPAKLRARFGVPPRDSPTPSQQGADVCVQIDADLSHDPADLPALLANVSHGADLAIGSRYVPGGRIERWPWPRRWLSRWGNRYAAGVLGLAVNDATAGFRAYRCETLRRIGYDTVTADGYGFQIEMTHRIVRAGGKIVEFPITFRDRDAGESKLQPRHRPRGVRPGRAPVGRRSPRPPPPPSAAVRVTTGGHGRVILHVDMDAFFVSVELLRRPELRGRPVVVGGTGRRGVVAAASYEARRYGVFSAMPSMRARQLCPHAVFLPGDYDSYARGERRGVRDPADVHAARRADLARRGVPRRQRIGRACSATAPRSAHADPRRGRRPDAADLLGRRRRRTSSSPRWRRSRPSRGPAPTAWSPGPGVFEVPPGREIEYLHPLPVRRLWGVGPATHERLGRLGVITIGDLAAVSPVALRGVVGQAAATRLLELASGIDERPVESERPVKSVSHEETFAFDLHDGDGPASRAGPSRRRGGLTAARRRARRPDDLAQGPRRHVPHGHPVAHPAPTGRHRHGDRRDRVRACSTRSTPTGGVRLLGVAASKFGEPAEQLQLDGLGDERASRRGRDASRAIDRVRGRFGRDGDRGGERPFAGRAEDRAPRAAPVGDRRAGRRSRTVTAPH